MLFRKKSLFEIVLFRNFFFLKIFKFVRKTQKLSLLRGELSQKVILCVQNFFQNLLLKNLFFIKIVFLKIIFFFKIWRVVEFLIQNHAF